MLLRRERDQMMSDRDCMLTTTDNPYNPFTEWDQWLKYDRDNGYYTNEYLDRVANTDDSFSNEENRALIRQAMKEIAENNPTNLWVLAYKPTKEI